MATDGKWRNLYGSTNEAQVSRDREAKPRKIDTSVRGASRCRHCLEKVYYVHDVAYDHPGDALSHQCKEPVAK